MDKGTPTEEITKKQWMKSYIMVAKKLNQAIKMNLIQTHRKVEEDVPGKPGIKNPETGETVTPPVDGVTKYGPVDGDPIVDKEEIPYETKREFDKDLAPGTEKVVQKGENGEKQSQHQQRKIH